MLLCPALLCAAPAVLPRNQRPAAAVLTYHHKGSIATMVLPLPCAAQVRGWTLGPGGCPWAMTCPGLRWTSQRWWPSSAAAWSGRGCRQRRPRATQVREIMAQSSGLPVVPGAGRDAGRSTCVQRRWAVHRDYDIVCLISSVGTGWAGACLEKVLARVADIWQLAAYCFQSSHSREICRRWPAVLLAPATSQLLL